jgi:N-acetylglucosamine-6-sulfatase
MLSTAVFMSGLVCLAAATDQSSTSFTTGAKISQPNIVFFLTDDQDQVLGGSFPPTAPGGATPMPRTNELLVQSGVMAENFFIHTPVCCPSRAETLSGRYLHNLKVPGKCKMGYDGKDDNGSTYCCMHVEENLVHNFSFPHHLKQSGYTTGMFGKYLVSGTYIVWTTLTCCYHFVHLHPISQNYCPGDCKDECSGEPIPDAFDSWLANGGGHYYSPSFSVKNIDGLPDGTFDGTATDYTTAVVGNHSVAWIRKVAKLGKPFLAYIAPKACHDPFHPAAWYKDYWSADWPPSHPRPVSYNMTYKARKNHHPTISGRDMLSTETDKCIENNFKNRWRTLMSVDDVVGAVVDVCVELGVAATTYFI